MRGFGFSCEGVEGEGCPRAEDAPTASRCRARSCDQPLDVLRQDVPLQVDRSPTVTAPRFVRSNVSGIRETSKPSPCSALTVRLTPLTATTPSRPDNAQVRLALALDPQDPREALLTDPPTVPIPSTCPCTTCPPRRSPARNASSRFTRAPALETAQRRALECLVHRLCPKLSVPTSMPSDTRHHRDRVALAEFLHQPLPRSERRARPVLIQCEHLPTSAINPVNIRELPRLAPADHHRRSPLPQPRGHQ